MKTAEETLQLLEVGINKRRQYLRRKLRRIEARGTQPGRGRPNEQNRLKYSGRAGMLSELTLIECLIKEIRSGELHPEEIWNEEDDTDDD